MDRELAFAILFNALCGSALLAAGWWPFREFPAASGRALERSAWRGIWLPFVPGLILFAALCGWAVVEPARAERLPFGLFAGAMPFAAILARAVWRALGSLVLPRQALTAATVGFFRPRIIFSEQIIGALDQRALAAALEHERAHARHRDPLRLWLAQLGADLLWPSSTAAARLRCWGRALELARDEEVRSVGVAGPDLAAAILGALRLNQASVPAGVATLSDEAFVKERVARLLQPLETELRRGHKTLALLFVVTVAVLLAVLLGIRYGEGLVRSIAQLA
jgi:Peptidase family M48